VLTKEMMATPTISLAMMSLMQTLARRDDSPDMSAPRAALLKRLEEVASKEWLAVLREKAPRADEGVAGGAVGGRSGATIPCAVDASESNEVRLRQIEGLNLQFPSPPDGVSVIDF
jgi:hypothetical protein